MAEKKNPLNLNPLQLKTLTLFQELARSEGRPATEEGHIVIGPLPHPHGDHFHLGDAVVMARDATGFTNQAVWTVLERKGLIQSGFPHMAVLTPAGLAYKTGLDDVILHRHVHH